uniref:GP-PDE domain-containing protein n=1 Tax=Chromera velia CCMP2878 TaxID=1169474 RepID=A0A0G4FCL4_9ALVE|eukprot:Cvel_3203.t1-p1 / transcript=Cvel_3203.t1 / gene=Cvel_3203 / organism=Chromera_velia_CCMP2878 / gene_product=hypothetical protein / transcript_product=hypothetical protein / location=Cvel_scaffold125:41318-46037(-) / protein_length=428 / sequence_SO=supercontig / SO=protein_coding / is_pseudo=false
MPANSGRRHVPIYGHRGFGVSMPGSPATVPENSFHAFEAAVAAGAEGAELDVWLTQDSEVIVTHGTGSDAEGFLHEVTLEGRMPDGRPLKIEDLDYKASLQAGGLILRDAWVNTVDLTEWGGDPSAASRLYAGMGQPRQAEERERYATSSVAVAVQTESPSGDAPTPQLEGPGWTQLPLLQEVLEQFQGRLKFNVELKGTKPDLSRRVKDIARQFPGTVARISTFMWLPPEEDAAALCLDPVESERADVEKCPNGHIPADLAGPLSNSSSSDSQTFENGEEAPDPPLALLYQHREAPASVDRVLQCHRRYGSDWAHLKFNTLLPPGFETGQLETKALGAPVALRTYVEALQEGGVRVMSWWGKGVDRPECVLASLWAGMDSICPNDVEMAKRVTNWWVSGKQGGEWGELVRSWDSEWKGEKEGGKCSR